MRIVSCPVTDVTRFREAHCQGVQGYSPWPTLGVSSSIFPPEIRINAEEGEGEWTITVKDNGIGANMEYSQEIFQMFQRLDAEGPFPGTGGCIAIVMKIVERHGGRIWVKSREGNGATFYFALPISGAHGKEKRNPDRTESMIYPLLVRG